MTRVVVRAGKRDRERKMGGEDRMQRCERGSELRRQKETRWRESRGLLEEINNGSVTLLPLAPPPPPPRCSIRCRKITRDTRIMAKCASGRISPPTRSYILSDILFFSAVFLFFYRLYWKIIITGITGGAFVVYSAYFCSPWLYTGEIKASGVNRA